MVEVIKEDPAIIHLERIETKERIKKIEESLAHLIVRVERLEEGCVLCQDDGK